MCKAKHEDYILHRSILDMQEHFQFTQMVQYAQFFIIIFLGISCLDMIVIAETDRKGNGPAVQQSNWVLAAQGFNGHVVCSTLYYKFALFKVFTELCCGSKSLH